MKTTGLILIICTLLSASSTAQIQNVNISGSYSGVFMLSGTTSDYKIIGSPYLSEDWMYGTIEMKSEIARQMSNMHKEKARIEQYTAKINSCNELIAQISDSGYQTTGLSFTRDEIDQLTDDQILDVKISHKEFAELTEFTREVEENLILFLSRLRAEYEAEITAIHEIKGLFRYNLYAQEFEMIYDKDTFSIVAPFNVQSISISNMKFMHGFYVNRRINHEQLGSAYFEVLNEGNCKLLLRHDVKIKSGGGPVTYNWAGSDADAFVKYKKLYYQQGDGSEVIPLKRRKKDIRKLFTDRYDVMERYIRNEKLNLKDDHELVKLFNFYNSLDS